MLPPPRARARTDGPIHAAHLEPIDPCARAAGAPAPLESAHTRIRPRHPDPGRPLPDRDLRRAAGSLGGAVAFLVGARTGDRIAGSSRPGPGLRTGDPGAGVVRRVRRLVCVAARVRQRGGAHGHVGGRTAASRRPALSLARRPPALQRAVRPHRVHRHQRGLRPVRVDHLRRQDRCVHGAAGILRPALHHPASSRERLDRRGAHRSGRTAGLDVRLVGVRGAAGRLPAGRRFVRTVERRSRQSSLGRGGHGARLRLHGEPQDPLGPVHAAGAGHARFAARLAGHPRGPGPGHRFGAGALRLPSRHLAQPLHGVGGPLHEPRSPVRRPGPAAAPRPAVRRARARAPRRRRPLPGPLAAGGAPGPGLAGGQPRGDHPGPEARCRPGAPAAPGAHQPGGRSHALEGSTALGTGHDAVRPPPGGPG